MKYTVAEFKKNTRKILNEALLSPVTITRFDDKFTISNASSMAEQAKDRTIVARNDEGDIVSVLGDLGDGSYGLKADHRGMCEHYQLKGQCLRKGCKYGKGAKKWPSSI